MQRLTNSKAYEIHKCTRASCAFFQFQIILEMRIQLLECICVVLQNIPTGSSINAIYYLKAS